MRIPGWLIFLGGFIGFVGMTALCSVLSYTTVRTGVIDARDAGVDGPSIAELADYLVNPPDVENAFTGFDDFVARQPTFTPAPTIALPTNTPPPGVTFTPAPSETPTEIVIDSDEPLAGIEPWNDPRRITVLLMGIDQRSATGDPGPFFTDTMILTQIDPINKRVGVLSIPRDLFVEIPGFAAGRINTANFQGDLNALPEGGPGLAMDTIYTNLGVNVDYYVRVNFTVFTELVDTIAPDGVEICVQEEIYDDHYPDAGFGFITVQFDPGCQILNSEPLLQYARTRPSRASSGKATGSSGSSSDRTWRPHATSRRPARAAASATSCPRCSRASTWPARSSSRSRRSPLAGRTRPNPSASARSAPACAGCGTSHR
jgi:LCP family protein required for cell wall assembly